MRPVASGRVSRDLALKPSSGPVGAPAIDSAVLLDAEGRRTIVHRGRIYLLRETSNGKLILTA